MSVFGAPRTVQGEIHSLTNDCMFADFNMVEGNTLPESTGSELNCVYNMNLPVVENLF